MNRLMLLLAISLGGSLFSVSAQNVSPGASNQIADFTQYSGGPARSIDLAAAFSLDPDVTDLVRLTTVLGDIDMALLGQPKPVTVINFLKYVDQGRYFLFDQTAKQQASVFVHRSVPGFVIQAGGYIGTVSPSPSPGSINNAALPTQVLAFNPIQNEPGISNKRGTIAMAKLGSDPNSATCEWFINLADNSGNLDTQNGGFTVFGKVVNNGMTTADSIAAVPHYNAGAPYDSIPLRNFSSGAAKVSNLVSIPTITHIPVFTASSDNANVTATVSGTKLLVSGNAVGTAHVTVTSNDWNGATTSQMFTVNVVNAPGLLANISTRMQVGTGDNVLIAGFIMRGSTPKRLAVRALGPSTGLTGAVVNPTLELHDSTGATMATSDNWGDAANKRDIIDIGLAPDSPNESVILTTVPSNANGAAYTAIMRGANNTTGLGLVEVYDLDGGPASSLLNISTRGQVGIDPNALIGGFILGGSDSKTILIRAIGPSLTAFGVPNALVDPTLELRDDNGVLVDSNDDWMTSPQKTQIQNSGLAPTNDKESAVVQTLAAGNYTAVVHGANGGTGVGSVEVYQLP
ncbi:MAG TPA: peptidylprolyl isomerase [Chthoniobacterales bacterium]|nr:peptidylprolyl isomerase [Chthoniobacterales bacterium]